MKKIKLLSLLTLFLVSGFTFAQEDTKKEDKKEEREGGHINENKFRQLNQELATPNQYRSATGAPGHAYYQQQANYVIDLVLDDNNQKITGKETITYINNSPDNLEYLWLQLDQNIRAKDSKSPLRNGGGVPAADQPGTFVGKHFTEPFDGGFNIQSVKDVNGKGLKHVINQTMMRIDLPTPLKAGASVSFSIDWWYNVNDHVNGRGRSGYEYFKDSDNYNYVIAQFFPRMCVYNDVEGWQNYQFWGNGEFALTFGDYDVNITVPADHIVDGTGELQNRKKVFTKTMMKRYEKAKTSYDKPVVIVTQEEAELAEKSKSTKTKTWSFKAKNVRDFAFTSSRKYIWDMQAVKLGARTVMAVSLYPKEGNPLWEEYSTKAVVQSLITYSDKTFDYPYHKAISVHAKNQGMEYPMICWNYGRPNADGTYSDRTKYGMISVIIHEVGHNYFPMIVNSDERQWGWMDEGLDTFLQYLTEQEFGENFPEAVAPNKGYPSRRGLPSKITGYMKGDQSFISPIMSNPEQVHQLGNNAYGKPATALNILRETVMGREAFDHAFKTYSKRWMFKHPTPEDFFRTMEDASGIDLDWFWRGWFYGTDFVDVGVKEVKKYYVTAEPTQEILDIVNQRGMKLSDLPPLIYLAEEGSKDYSPKLKEKSALENSKVLSDYMMDNFTASERANMKSPKYFYEIVYNKPGGLVMPLIVQYEYSDGTKEKITYPAQVWRKNDKEAKKVVASEKEIVKITVDPDLETADIDVTNNSWPKEEKESDFNKMKEKLKK